MGGRNWYKHKYKFENIAKFGDGTQYHFAVYGYHFATLGKTNISSQHFTFYPSKQVMCFSNETHQYNPTYCEFGKDIYKTSVTKIERRLFCRGFGV